MSLDRGPRQDRHETVATLVRSVPVRLVEVSRDGCRLECSSHVNSGTSGQLAVELAGLMRIDDVRVARCQQRMGAGPVYQLGAELLRTRRLARRTVRMAVRKIISGSAGVERTNGDEGTQLAASPGLRDTGGKLETRAPPGAERQA